MAIAALILCFIVGYRVTVWSFPPWRSTMQTLLIGPSSMKASQSNTLYQHQLCVYQWMLTILQMLTSHLGASFCAVRNVQGDLELHSLYMAYYQTCKEYKSVYIPAKCKHCSFRSAISFAPSFIRSFCHPLLPRGHIADSVAPDQPFYQELLSPSAA